MSMIDAKSRSLSRAAASRLRIDGGRVLLDDRFETTSVDVEDGLIRDVGRDERAARGARSMPAASWCCRGSSTFTAMPSSGR